MFEQWIKGSRDQIRPRSPGRSVPPASTSGGISIYRRLLVEIKIILPTCTGSKGDKNREGAEEVGEWGFRRRRWRRRRRRRKRKGKRRTSPYFSPKEDVVFFLHPDNEFQPHQ